MKRRSRKIDICGTTYTLRYADVDEDGHLPGFKSALAYGYTDTEKCEIVLDRKLSPGRHDMILVHEVLHAILDAQGLCSTLKLNKRTEELLIHGIAPAIVSSLRSLGLLRRD